MVSIKALLLSEFSIFHCRSHFKPKTQTVEQQGTVGKQVEEFELDEAGDLIPVVHITIPDLLYQDSMGQEVQTFSAPMQFDNHQKELMLQRIEGSLNDSIKVPRHSFPPPPQKLDVLQSLQSTNSLSTVMVNLPSSRNSSCNPNPIWAAQSAQNLLCTAPKQVKSLTLDSESAQFAASAVLKASDVSSFPEISTANPDIHASLGTKGCIDLRDSTNQLFSNGPERRKGKSDIH